MMESIEFNDFIFNFFYLNIDFFLKKKKLSCVGLMTQCA